MLRDQPIHKAAGLGCVVFFFLKPRFHPSGPKMHPACAFCQPLFDVELGQDHVIPVGKRDRVKRGFGFRVVYLTGFFQEMRHRGRAGKAPFLRCHVDGLTGVTLFFQLALLPRFEPRRDRIFIGKKVEQSGQSF